MCFGGSFFPISFSLPPFSISISWFDFLPLLAGMAFGGRYGFMASTLGFGALYPFVLWPSNGWACLVTSLLLISWTTANGYLRGLRQRKPAFWNLRIWFLRSPYWSTTPASSRYFRSRCASIPRSGIRGPSCRCRRNSFIPSSSRAGCNVFHILALFVDYILKLPVLRKLFGLEMEKGVPLQRPRRTGHFDRHRLALVRLYPLQPHTPRGQPHAELFRARRPARGHVLADLPFRRDRLRLRPGILPVNAPTCSPAD